jgi:hypothetical protein
MPALREKIMSLINSGNPRNRSVLVVQNFISHMRRDTEARHSGNASPPQVMKPPSGDTGQFIKLSLGNAEALKRGSS